MPLLFDMPFEKLHTYKDTIRARRTLKLIGNSGLAEMNAIDPEIELARRTFKRPMSSAATSLTGVHGARIHAKLLQPKHAKEPHPAVLMYHGYSGNAGDSVDKLGYVAMGYTVAALDCRGQGGLSEDVGGVKGWTLRGHIIRGLDDAPEEALFRQMLLDTAQLAKIVMAMPDVDATQRRRNGR